MLPEPKRFTKEAPCSKADLWHCFKQPDGFAPVQIARAHSIIGLNVPRGMERMGRLCKQEIRGIQYYELTEAGERWLTLGILTFMKNHPLRKIRNPPKVEDAKAPKPIAGRIRRIVRR